MDFIDESRIFLKAGDGGNGCCSFRREKYIPRGGPDGGDGGKGGDIFIQASSRVHTLLDQRYHPHYNSQRGQHGQGQDRTGRGGEDCIITVPVGTVIKDRQTGVIIADLVEDRQRVLVARGGRGGRGNARFVSSTNRAPRLCEPGEAGEELDLMLELKLLADIALVGFPNAGKSTLISKISHARPKVADYPFTTLSPHLGLVRWKGSDFVVADIPGIIEGAHAGHGLGLRFLRHIERTRMLVYVIDMSPSSELSAAEELGVLTLELSSYSSELAQRDRLVVLNKCDLPSARERAQEAVAFLRDTGYRCHLISALTGEGIDGMLDDLIKGLHAGV